MARCTIGAIVTRPTGNTQGGYYFIHLDTGHRIDCRDWTSLPMPTKVIDQVHRLARHAKANTQLTLTNIGNEDLDILYARLPDDNDEPASLDGAPAGVHGEHNNDKDSDYHPNEESDDSDDNSDSSSHNTDNDNTTTASEQDIKITGVDDNVSMDENNPHEHVNNNNKAMETGTNTDYNAKTGGRNTEEEAEAEYDPSTKIVLNIGRI